MKTSTSHKLPMVAVLGAGLAGLGAAWQLARRGLARVVVLERSDAVGGNAGSFDLDGIPADFGSHRLHTSCEPHILRDIQSLLGEDLVQRPRHGRIRLQGRWVHFPLRPLDLLTHLPWSFGFGVLRDLLAKTVSARSTRQTDTFAGVMECGLGRTICREFYFPYTTKIWGRMPADLSPIQARRRVSAGSLSKMLRKALGLESRGTPGKKHFFYPRRGFGQIAEAIAADARRHGVDIRLNSVPRRIRLGPPHRLDVECEGRNVSFDVDRVWSTIPVPQFVSLLDPPAPTDVIEACSELAYRAMVLVYLVLDQAVFTEYDAHYFPETDIPLTRLSEPKNYSAARAPEGRTVLCGEIPCAFDDATWRSSDDTLKDVMLGAMAKAGLPAPTDVKQVASRRLTHAYPVYRIGYEKHLQVIEDWLMGIPAVLSFGRQGLFAHDNVHHTLAMAYAAADCVDPASGFDVHRWRRCRSEFDNHVVED